MRVAARKILKEHFEVTEAEDDTAARAQAFATPAPAAMPTSEPPLPPTLEVALAMIAAGEEEELTSYLDVLVRRVLPLLELWDRHHDASLAVCFNTLRHKLESR
jgi:hypothetical protein